MNGGINVGSIYADLEINSGKVETGLAAGRGAIYQFANELKKLDTELAAGTISLATHGKASAVLKDHIANMAAALQAAIGSVSGLSAQAVASTASCIKYGNAIAGVTSSTGAATAATATFSTTVMAAQGPVNTVTASINGMASAANNAASAFKSAANAVPGFIGGVNNAVNATNKFHNVPNMVQAKIINPMKGGSDSAKFFGRSMMQLGYIVDDLQYSFMAAVNNIGPFALAMGAGAGVAGGIQVAAVAAAQLYSHWHLIEDAFMSNVVRTQAEEMAILAKETAKTADEVKRLADYEKERSDATAIYSQRSKDEKEQIKDVDKAIDNINGQQVSKTLGAIMKMEGGKLPEAEENAIRREAYKRLPLSLANAMPSASMSDAALKAKSTATSNESRSFKREIEAVKESHYAEAASRLLASAKTDPGALNRLIELVGKSPESFPKGFLSDLKNATPESSKLGRELTEQGKENELWMKQNDRLAAQKEAAANKEGVAGRRNDKNASKEEKDRVKEQVRMAKTLMASSTEDAANLYDRVEKGDANIDSAVGTLRAALEMSGMNKEDARSAAIGLMEERAAMDPDARRSDMKRRANAKESEAHEKTRMAERRVHENRKKAEEAVPGIEAIAEREAAAGILGGGTMEQVAASIAATLRDAGMKPADAAEQAAQLAKEGASSLYSKANSAATGKDQKESFSQVFNTDDLRSRVQGGISNKQQEQTDLLKMAVERLTEIVQVSGKTLKIKVD